MYKCDLCIKEFKSKQALGAHSTIHKVDGRYSVSRRKVENDITHICLNCGISFKHNTRSKNKYCTIKCYAEFTLNDNVEKYTISEIGGPAVIKRFLIDRDGNNCFECKLPPIWNDKPLVLQIDHVDGNSDNNNPNNMRLLCPNCHTQTETFSGKGYGNTRRKYTKRNKYLRNRKIMRD